MKHLKLVVFFLISFLTWSGQGIAGTNPIGWTLNQPFPNPVYSGSLYKVTYTFTNNLPLQLVKPIVIKKDASLITEFSYADTCTGTRLLHNQSCTVQITLSPLVAGDKYVQLSIAGYDDNVVPLPELRTFANAATTSGTVVGTPVHDLPSKMDVNASASYVFSFTNYSDKDANNLALTVTQTTGTVNSTNTCTGSLTANGGFCTVTGEFTPASNSPTGQSVQASLAYTGPTGSPATTNTSTVLNGSVPGGPIVGSVAVGASLPPLMIPDQSITGTPGGVEFLFTNTSSDTMYYFPISTPTVVLTWTNNNGLSGSCPSSLSATEPACGITQNNCIASLPDNFAACSVYTNFTSPTGAASSPPLTYTLTATLSYSSSVSGPFTDTATANTSATVLATLPTERTIKMVNNCGYAIGYSLNGGASPCGPGTVNVGGSCFWTNYTGTTNGALPSGGVDYVTIPANDIGGIQWSGNMSAMTGCDQVSPNIGKSCTQAICGNGGTGPCLPSVGFNTPATQVEITMLTSGVDSYDGEVINGFHIPISMQPYYYIDPTDSANDIQATPDGFSCGTPGNFTATNGFGACNWDTATVPSTPASSVPYYYVVGGGSGTHCSSSPCSVTTEICGLSQPVPNAAISEPICGNFQGYWTPNQLCTESSNLPADVKAGLNCATPLPPNFNLATDPYDNTYTSLMACHVAKGYTGPVYASCYTTSYTGIPPATADQCCGCVDWWETSQTIGNVVIGANTTSQTCPTGHVDQNWINDVQGGIQWLKQACPSIYVYPFDDTTSKFTCTNNTLTGTNSTSYVITFCSGNTGLPSGKTDGRG